MVSPWKKGIGEVIGKFEIFDIERIPCHSPTSGKEHTFFKMHTSDWVNVIPVTPRGTVVFVEQWRAGTDEVTLEIPGGKVDEGEEPARCAERELLEETGYSCDRIVSLGKVRPNPAFQNNSCHVFLALNATKVAEQRLDEAEEVDVVEFELEQVDHMILSGTIDHALTLSSFYLFSCYQRALSRGEP